MKYSVNLFTHDAASKSFCAEMSDLGPMSNPSLQTITLVSDLGCEATFEVCEIIDIGNEYEQEIGGWKFRPTRESLERIPRLKDYTLTIFND